MKEEKNIIMKGFLLVFDFHSVHRIVYFFLIHCENEVLEEKEIDDKKILRINNF